MLWCLNKSSLNLLKVKSYLGLMSLPKRLKSLKAAGISVAIDHFGAGFAGLLLLSRFQPDRIKISQELITNVHKSGPRQAIIQAIMKCCTSLEIQSLLWVWQHQKSGCGLNLQELRCFREICFPKLN
ncbi:EAL domain-containing protein [Escherichia coli]|uniref:EAL domain-containing protein n=1 Tax=Escherichia coli TaxID=562 RepID=A0A377K7P8_ECOLX|nr:EAL domain-containing protein [Escherichia coli]